MSGTTRERHWVSAPALLAVVAVLVVPATTIHPRASAETARPPALVAVERPVVRPAASTPQSPAAVRRAAIAQAAYAVATRPPLVRQALAWADQQLQFPTRTCLYFVRIALQVPRRFPTAMSAWQHARYRHRTPLWAIPAGVPVYTKGQDSAGHIAISLGNGWVRSTDWPRDGLVGDVRITTLLRKWHHRYLGWSEDLNGVRVWNLGGTGWSGSWSAPHRR